MRVLRLVQYVGPREEVEKQVGNSIHGTRILRNGLKISAVTLLEFPTLVEAEQTPDPQQLVDLQRQADEWKKRYETLLDQSTEVVQQLKQLQGQATEASDGR